MSCRKCGADETVKAGLCHKCQQNGGAKRRRRSRRDNMLREASEFRVCLGIGCYTEINTPPWQRFCPACTAKNNAKR